MFSWKKYLPTLILLLIVYGAYFFTHSSSSHPTTLNVLGANTAITLYEEPDNGRQPILGAIQSAQKEIDVEVYLLSDKQIIAALENAEARGITVKVMLEQHPVGSTNINPKTQQELASNGIQTEWTNPSFSLTHEKAIVLDGTIAFILSQNLTTSAFTKNREYDVFDTNPADVAEIQSIFINDWNRTSFSPPKNSNIIESPDNSRAALTTLINATTQTLDVETEDIDDTNIITVLSEKAKTAHVRLLVPTVTQLPSNKNALQQLTSAGVEIKTIRSPYMHAKMMLADNAKAYVGSINLSTQSMDDNREVGIIMTQPESLQKLNAAFETDWSKGVSFQ